MAGTNRALLSESSLEVVKASATRKPCIFLSHISIDKVMARNIANYIMVNGDIDVYFDENDTGLRMAVNLDRPALITSFIEAGLSASSHIMCLVTENTVGSWWVPYEIGYAKKDSKEIATLKLKGNVILPPFLEIGEILKGTKSLNLYLEKTKQTFAKAFGAHLIQARLIEAAAQPHPLDDYLEWNH